MRNLIPKGLFNLLILLVIFTAQSYLQTTSNLAFARDKDSTEIYDQLKAFTDVLAIVRRDYVKEVDEKKLVEGAIKGMLATLDPHSGYLDPDFYKDLQVQTSGEFGGLGIEITIKKGMLVVVSPMEGSPASKAGIEAGDTIVKIDGKFAREFSLIDAVKKLRGPKGSPVRIAVQRGTNKSLKEITVVRDNINVKSVKRRYLGDGYAYVRISQFMETTADDLKTALKAVLKESKLPELRGLIMDLRNNPGGLLTQAILVSDMFLKEGVVVYTEGRVENQKQKFYAHERDTEPEYPLVVLVNGGSASASEIVAGAFKDHGRALVLGTQTFGKGSVQTITPLENGGAVTLTTALYFTKNGISLQSEGVKPDIELELKHNKKLSKKEKKEAEDLEGFNIRESDLPGAIENPHHKSNKSPLQKLNSTPIIGEKEAKIDPEVSDLQTWFNQDNQMERAFELLKTFNIFQTNPQINS